MFGTLKLSNGQELPTKNLLDPGSDWR